MHFCVLVTAQNRTELEKVLAPYQENNMGDCPEEFLEFMPSLTVAEAKEGWDQLRARLETTPLDELEDYERKFKERPPTTLVEFVREWHGHRAKNTNLALCDDPRPLRADEIDALMPRDDTNFWGYWENPRAEWDWYQVGGRYTGRLSDYDPEEDPLNREICDLCGGTGDRPGWVTYEEGERVFKDDWAEKCNGCNGCQGKGTRLAWPTRWAERQDDSPLVKEVDWAKLRGIAHNAAVKMYDTYHEAQLGSVEIPEADLAEGKVHFAKETRYGEAVRERFPDPEAFTRHYMAVQALGRNYMSWQMVDDLMNMSRAGYAAWCSDKALTWAYISPDGGWHEGAGYDATISERRAWGTEFWTFIESLGPEQRVCVVDCHI